jgi:acyl-coenzyme A synthetase/AMP-(fatty) acid ligase
MLHIFLSNRPGRNRNGTSGEVVPGYEAKLIDETGKAPVVGELGELWVKGDSGALGYWNQPEKTADTLQASWTRTGDKYLIDDDGYFVHCGRTDDMLKVGGIWVSPSEVESTLVGHDSVLEAAVVGRANDRGLIKPQAFIVLSEGVRASSMLAKNLQDHVKKNLAPHKYPRWVEFVDKLPRTSTGKIQRFKLRASEKSPD